MKAFNIDNHVTRVVKKFPYEDIELRIAYVNSTYMNSPDHVNVKAVLAPNGGQIPVMIQRDDTLKDIINKVTILLDSFKQRGANILNECTKELQLPTESLRVYEYENKYRHCESEWSDTWTSMCNDRCPECDSEIEPYESITLNYK